MITKIQESESPKWREELLSEVFRIQKKLAILLDGFKEDIKHLEELRELLPIRDNTICHSNILHDHHYTPYMDPFPHPRSVANHIRPPLRLGITGCKGNTYDGSHN